jgi:hypothetical protein
MIKKSLIIFCFLFLIITSCSEQEATPVPEEYVPPKYEVIQPDSLSSDSKFYKIHNLNFHLPKGFVVRKFLGPDFTVYRIWYPGGVGGGIFFGQFPDIPDRLSMLTSGRNVYEEFKRLPNDPFNLLKPERIFDSIGYYIERYENVEAIPYTYTSEFNREYDKFDKSKITPDLQSKFFTKDSLILELSKTDSLLFWKSYPIENEFGAVDLIITDNMPYGWKTHFFTRTNKILTTELVLDFMAQLCK